MSVSPRSSASPARTTIETQVDSLSEPNTEVEVEPRIVDDVDVDTTSAALRGEGSRHEGGVASVDPEAPAAEVVLPYADESEESEAIVAESISEEEFWECPHCHQMVPPGLHCSWCGSPM